MSEAWLADWLNGLLMWFLEKIAQHVSHVGGAAVKLMCL
jgi:hypothetical protein